MRTTRGGIIAIAGHEALVTTSYQDGTKGMSYAFGHYDKHMKPGTQISVRDSFALLVKDIGDREPELATYLPADAAPTTWDAMMSTFYQSGHRYVPMLGDMMKAGRLDLVAQVLPFCARSAENIWQDGLQVRRLAELKILQHGDYGNLTTIPFWDGDPKVVPRQVYTIQPGDL